MARSNSERVREIKAELMRKGVTQADIAKKIGVSQQMVSSVILGKATSAKAVQALVEAGVPEELFKDSVA